MADAVERTVRDTDLLREPGPAGETD
jgi:hypothetical protein